MALCENEGQTNSYRLCGKKRHCLVVACNLSPVGNLRIVGNPHKGLWKISHDSPDSASSQTRLSLQRLCYTFYNNGLGATMVAPKTWQPSWATIVGGWFLDGSVSRPNQFACVQDHRSSCTWTTATALYRYEVTPRKQCRHQQPYFFTWHMTHRQLYSAVNRRDPATRTWLGDGSMWWLLQSVCKSFHCDLTVYWFWCPQPIAPMKSKHVTSYICSPTTLDLCTFAWI